MKRIATLPLVVLFVTILFAAALPSAAVAEEGFTPLFDGKTLDGWKKVGGGATYQVEGDSIVGRVGPGPNTFLRTEKTFGDFVLKLEMKFDVPGNSGIQFRSHQRKHDGRVFGYQCEIDQTERGYSGGIYDEARRGWIFDLEGRDAARAAFKLDGWNEFVIKAVGPMIQTWINGVPCADLIDTADLEGFIALQVHSGKQGVIRWRNIRLKDLGQSRWQPLFDGKSFDGWRKIGGGKWNIEDSLIHGTSSKNEKRHGHLITNRQYADFALRVKFKAIRGNSGLYFRVEEGGTAGVAGFQAEIDPDEHDSGGLYETSGRAWVVKPKGEDVQKWYRPNEWNELSVVAVGRRIVVHLNGMKTVELKDDPGRLKGHVALQLHAGQDMDVWFKNVEILEIPSAK
jgi:hypothetical protein